jgi:hypothetical protein
MYIQLIVHILPPPPVMHFKRPIPIVIYEFHAEADILEGTEQLLTQLAPFTSGKENFERHSPSYRI